MNHYVIKAAIGTVAAMMLSVATHAATIWQPTDVLATGNVNILQFDIPGLTLNGGSLALFEDTDNAYAAPLVLGSDGGVLEFADNMDGTFSVTALINNVPQGAPLLITGNEFKLGVDWGIGYVGDSGFTQDSGDATTFIVSFTDGKNVGDTLAVDLTPVPLPAAAMLFGSALLGLVGIKRRKS